MATTSWLIASPSPHRQSGRPSSYYRDVRRGDIIVFFKPGKPDLFLVKRTIGIPGDRIHLRNGDCLSQRRRAKRAATPRMPTERRQSPCTPSIPTATTFPPYPPDNYEDNVTASWAYRSSQPHPGCDDLIVPPGKVFAMGDNRTESLDGRYWGFVPRENIVGRPLFVYWSFKTPADQIDKQSVTERLSFMGHILIHIFDQTRWNRTLHLIR